MTRSLARRGALALLLLPAALGAWTPWAAPEEKALAPGIVHQLREEAGRLRPWVRTGLARAFLDRVDLLPAPEPRTIYRDKSRRAYVSAAAAAELPARRREKLEPVEILPETYYTTRYGTPLAYVRALDLLAESGFTSFSGRRILDFGYGTIGHLELMASLGADVVGVDVDTWLEAVYSDPGDRGPRRNPDGPEGRITLVSGHWPGTREVREAAGPGFDLILSKNTLKPGYIHPERKVDPRHLVHLKVSDRDYVRAVFQDLKPGGLFLIYNLAPPQNPPSRPYIPWADGRCPFQPRLLEKAGFEILFFDRDDTVAAREMGRLLGWDDQGIDLETGLFAHATLLRKPRAEGRPE